MGTIAVLAVVGFVDQTFGEDETTPERANTTSFGEGDAWLNCQDAVKDQLRNPATADFSMLSSDIERADDGWFEISGSLNAENDYGVKQEIGFSCRVKEGEPVQAEVASN